MSDWPEVTLGSVARVEIGGTPSRNETRYWSAPPHGYPWLSIADLKSKRVSDTKEFISDSGVTSSNVKLIPFGTPVMSFKLTIGRCAIADRDLYSNEAIAAFHVDTETVDPEWLYYELPNAAARAVTDTAIKGATLNKAKIKALQVALPPLPEQRQIAEILDTIDEAILKTDAIIAKLEQLKQGLVHDLLTRGIDDNGKLRDPVRHPEQFKDSALGRIPASWEAAPLSSSAVIIDPNPSHRYPVESSEGIPIASTENFSGENDFDLEFCKRVPERLFDEQNARCCFDEQDVVFARKGRIGLARPYGADRKVFSHTVVLMKPKAHRMSPTFLLWIVRADSFFRGIRDRMNFNVGVPTLGVGFLGAVPIVIPPLEEQRWIAHRLDQISLRIGRESVEASKLRSLKNGLAEDLLTGSVRVTSMLDEAK